MEHCLKSHPQGGISHMHVPHVENRYTNTVHLHYNGCVPQQVTAWVHIYKLMSDAGETVTHIL